MCLQYIKNINLKKKTDRFGVYLNAEKNQIGAAFSVLHSVYKLLSTLYTLPGFCLAKQPIIFYLAHPCLVASYLL